MLVLRPRLTGGTATTATTTTERCREQELLAVKVQHAIGIDRAAVRRRACWQLWLAVAVGLSRCHGVRQRCEARAVEAILIGSDGDTQAIHATVMQIRDSSRRHEALKGGTREGHRWLLQVDRVVAGRELIVQLGGVAVGARRHDGDRAAACCVVLLHERQHQSRRQELRLDTHKHVGLALESHGRQLQHRLAREVRRREQHLIMCKHERLCLIVLDRWPGGGGGTRVLGIDAKLEVVHLAHGVHRRCNLELDVRQHWNRGT